MTPKEKAQELFNKMFSPPNCVISLHRQSGRTFLAKQCALIAVDEIIKSYISICDDCICDESHYGYALYGMLDYYKEVKQEIEKL